MREEEKKQSSLSSSLKRFFKKRWVFPAIYIASAAIILSAVLWYQSVGKDSKDFDYKATNISGKKNGQQPAIEVNRAMENIKMPLMKPDLAVIKNPFYDPVGKEEDQEAALIVYENQYRPNTGIDIATKSGESFEVVAALSGTVKKVEEDALLGNVIEIEHDKGIVTQYQSVTEIKVKVGEKIEQGQALAKAGQSLLNEKAGIHVHFEIRKNNIPVNPSAYMNKPLSAIQEATVAPESKKMDEQVDDSKEKQTDKQKQENKQSENKSTESSENSSTKSTEKKEQNEKKPAETNTDRPASDKQDTPTNSTEQKSESDKNS